MQPSKSPVTHFLSDDDAKKAHQEINLVEPQFIFMPESYNGVECCTILLYQGLSRLCLTITEICTMCFKAMDYARQELNVFCSPPPFDLTSFFDCHFCLKRRPSVLNFPLFMILVSAFWRGRCILVFQTLWKIYN
jgi:hypothetical protein